MKVGRWVALLTILLVAVALDSAALSVGYNVGLVLYPLTLLLMGAAYVLTFKD